MIIKGRDGRVIPTDSLPPAAREALEAGEGRRHSVEGREEERRIRSAVAAEFPPAPDAAGPGAPRAEVSRIIARLAAARQQRGMTLDELSSRSGIDPAQLSRLEGGKVPNPTTETLCRYAGALGLELTIDLAEPEECPPRG